MRRTAPAALGLLAALALAACAGPPPPPRLTLSPTSFDRLAGWRADRQSVALGAFRRSCARLATLPGSAPIGPGGLAGSAADWRPPCAAAATVPEGDDAAARRFFEAAFRPFALGDNGVPDGLFTGYYEPELRGARRPAPGFAVPLYRRPPDLVMVDLGLFRPDWRGEHIAGRVDGGRLRPYASRAEIERGALGQRGLELVWVADPVDAFFLEIQGSGRVDLPDGSAVELGYDGQNGRTYVPIGRLLVERGALPREAVSMQSIRAWLAAHPAQAPQLMDANPSYVFFRVLPGAGPVGAEGATLTAGRSLAVDRKFLPLGAPVWLDAADPAAPAGRLQRLLVAQDTGGAIRGPVRGDLFWGFGAAAAARAGMMKDRGTYYLLLPRNLAVRRAATS